VCCIFTTASTNYKVEREIKFMTDTYFLGMYNEAVTYVYEYFKLFKPELRQIKMFLVNKFLYYEDISKNNKNITA
jgi:hypothetical protein